MIPWPPNLFSNFVISQMRRHDLRTALLELLADIIKPNKTHGLHLATIDSEGGHCDDAEL